MSDDTIEGKREIIKVKASIYTNYSTKRPDELIVDTEIGRLDDQSTDDYAQFRLQSEGIENNEFTQRRLEAEALEDLKEKGKGM